MEEKMMREKDLKRVFFTLFKEIKKGVEKEKYPVFSVESVEVVSDKKIKFQNKENASNLRVCLKSFGDLLYELATGSSALNSLSAYIDPAAKPIESELWPAISMMISGNAYSIPQVEDLVKREPSSLSKIGKALLGFFRSIGRFWQNHYIGVMNTALTIASIASVAELVAYLKFNWNFSGEKVVLCSIVFVVVFFGCQIGQYKDTLQNKFASLIILISAMFLYAASSFWYSGWETEEYTMLIDRKTNEFAAYLPKSVVRGGQSPVNAWDHYYINHFKYKVVKNNFSFSGSVNFAPQFVIGKSNEPGAGETKFDLKINPGLEFSLKYDIPIEMFNKASDSERDVMHASISRSLTDIFDTKIMPKLQTEYLETLKNFENLSISPEEVFLSEGKFNAYKTKVEGEVKENLRKVLKIEVEEIGFPIPIKLSIK